MMWSDPAVRTGVAWFVLGKVALIVAIVCAVIGEYDAAIGFGVAWVACVAVVIVCRRWFAYRRLLDVQDVVRGRDEHP